MNYLKADLFSADLKKSSFYEELTKGLFRLTLSLRPDDFEKNKGYAVGDKHCNLFSDFVSRLTEAKGLKEIVGQLHLLLDSELVNIDPGFLGLLALFRERFPKISISLELKYPEQDGAYFRLYSILFSIRDWYEQLTHCQLFSIVGEEKINRRYVHEPGGIFPIIRIEPVSFQQLFTRTNSSLDFEQLLQNVPIDEFLNELSHQLSLEYAKKRPSYAVKNYRSVRNTFKILDKKVLWGNNNRLIFQNYLQILAEFDLLPDIVERYTALTGNPIVLNSFKKSGLKDEQMNNLKLVIGPLLQKLHAEPPMLTLLFAVLLSHNLDKIIVDYENYIDRLSGLYQFARNLFIGLREIARNIIEHTPTQTGILTGRVYNGDVLPLIKDFRQPNQRSGLLSKYYRSLGIDPRDKKNYEKYSFLNIQIFDEGEKGIVPNIIANLENLSETIQTTKNLFYNDLIELKEKRITFPDFYDARQIKLNHNAIKSASHWGLLVFTNLIQKNKGMFAVSSRGEHSGDFDSCLKFENGIFSPTKRGDFFSLGTFYDITLPLDSDYPLTDASLINTVPKESNFAEFNFIELFKYHYTDDPRHIRGKGQHDLLHIRLSGFVDETATETHQVEIKTAGKVADYIKKHSREKSKFIPVVDFQNVEQLSEQSKLFRFLAELQNTIDIYSIILINIRQEVIRDLFNTLSDSQKANGVMTNPFWNDGHFVLIYSYEEGGAQKSRLYAANMLGGATYQDFFILNQKIAATHFTNQEYNYPPTLDLTSATKECLNACPFYVTATGVLQNFEMIIEHDGRSLFEHSVEYILNQEVDY